MSFIRIKHHLINLNHVTDIRYNDGATISIYMKEENRILIYYDNEAEAEYAFDSLSNYLALNNGQI